MASVDLTGSCRPGFLARINRLLHSSEIPPILRLTLPIACISLANMAMSITDTVMAAWFGTQALAAVAVGSDFYSIVFYLAAGLIAGIAPAYAAASAAGDDEQMRKLRSAGWLVALGPTAVAVPAIWFAPNYLPAIGIDASILEAGAGYTRAMALTLVPMCALCFLRTRMTAIEKPGAILRVVLASIPVNAGLNYLFMHGIAGWSGLGITGAGVASILTACFMASMLALMAYRHGDRGLARAIDWSIVRETFRVGIPIGVTTLAEVGVYLGATLFVAGFGSDATAAHALTLRMAGLAYALIGGLSQASTVRMARSDAEGGMALRRETVRAAGIAAIGTGVVLPAILILCAILGLEMLPAMGLSTEATETAFWLLIILAVTEIIEPIGCTASGLLRGRSDTQVPMYFALLGNWAIGVPVGLILSVGFGMEAIGVWAGLLVGLTTAAIPTIARVRTHV